MNRPCVIPSSSFSPPLPAHPSTLTPELSGIGTSTAPNIIPPFLRKSKHPLARRCPPPPSPWAAPVLEPLVYTVSYGSVTTWPASATPPDFSPPACTPPPAAIISSSIQPHPYMLAPGLHRVLWLGNHLASFGHASRLLAAQLHAPSAAVISPGRARARAPGNTVPVAQEPSWPGNHPNQLRPRLPTSRRSPARRRSSL